MQISGSISINSAAVAGASGGDEETAVKQQPQEQGAFLDLGLGGNQRV